MVTRVSSESKISLHGQSWSICLYLTSNGQSEKALSDLGLQRELHPVLLVHSPKNTHRTPPTPKTSKGAFNLQMGILSLWLQKVLCCERPSQGCSRFVWLWLINCWRPRCKSSSFIHNLKQLQVAIPGPGAEADRPSLWRISTAHATCIRIDRTRILFLSETTVYGHTPKSVDRFKDCMYQPGD